MPPAYCENDIWQRRASRALYSLPPPSPVSRSGPTFKPKSPRGQPSRCFVLAYPLPHGYLHPASGHCSPSLFKIPTFVFAGSFVPHRTRCARQLLFQRSSRCQPLSRPVLLTGKAGPSTRYVEPFLPEAHNADFFVPAYNRQVCNPGWVQPPLRYVQQAVLRRDMAGCHQ